MRLTKGGVLATKGGRWFLSYDRRRGNVKGIATQRPRNPTSRPRDRDRRGRSEPLACLCGLGRGGDRGSLWPPYPQAGRPASASIRADGVCRDRMRGVRAGCGWARFLAPPLRNLGGAMVATLHVCTTCKGTAAAAVGCADCPVGDSGAGACGACPLADGGATRPGERLMAQILAQPCPEGVRVAPIECLSACGQGCTV